MDIAARREQLMIYLADATDRQVNALYNLLKEDIKGTSFTLGNEHLDILKQRKSDYLSGKSIPIPWREAHEKIRNKRKNA